MHPNPPKCHTLQKTIKSTISLIKLKSLRAPPSRAGAWEGFFGALFQTSPQKRQKYGR